MGTHHSRVLYTNRERSVQLLWARHTGSDVYWSTPGADHRSYHNSGRIHTKRPDGTYDEVVQHVRLSELKGQFSFGSMTFSNSADGPSAWTGYPDFSERKGDSLLVIDSRSIPAGAAVCVMFGLLEPGRLDILNGMIALGTASRVLLGCDVSPWLYACWNWWESNEAMGAWMDELDTRFRWTRERG